jgi:dihydropteroate synthase
VLSLAQLAAQRLVVMGVLNVTPDSFSDGGRYVHGGNTGAHVDLDGALAHALQMHAQGAQLVDVGGESTRPGAERVDAEIECRRVLPVIRALVAAGVPCSVDTYRASVAARALEAGALVVNDVSGGLGDADMARVVREAGCPWILMHWRGHSSDMQRLAHYDDVVDDVRAELLARVDAAVAAGVEPSRLVLDPGLGFAKTAAHNWALLARLDELVALGLPVLVGASRKSFLGSLLAAPDGQPRPVGQREDATVAVTTYAALHGAWGVRVHDVGRSADAAQVAAAIGQAAAVSPAAALSPAAPGELRHSVLPAGTHPVGARRAGV